MAGEWEEFEARLRRLTEGLKGEGWRTELRGAAGPAAGTAKGEPGVDEEFLGELCRRARELVMEEAAFLELQPPIRICGDIHGQYTDLCRIFRRNGWPGEEREGGMVRYLFLGDYVDRGPNSLEVVVLLLGLKLLKPSSVWLLRGNHEAGAINQLYGFLEECQRRYSEGLWKLFSHVFNSLPFCAVVGGRILCMHGGLSSELRSWEQLRRVRRPCDVPDTGLLCDLLWADPDPDAAKGFVPSHRGVSFKFAADVVRRFCEAMDLDLIVRAHQVCEDGYEFFARQRLLTLFSAPNYCGEYDNAAASLHVAQDLLCSFDILRLHVPRPQPAPATAPSPTAPDSSTATPSANTSTSAPNPSISPPSTSTSPPNASTSPANTSSSTANASTSSAKS